MIPLFATGVNHEELCRLAEQNFKSLPSVPAQLPELKPCRYTGAEMRARNDDMPFAHIAMAVEVRRVGLLSDSIIAIAACSINCNIEW